MGKGIVVGAALALLTGSAGSAAPSATPEIAYSYRGDVWTARIDGSDRRRLTRGPGFEGAPAWSPDGTRIAYVSEVRRNAEIFVMDADGRNVERLTRARADDYSPAWSPDGKRIAFSSNRAGPFEIYVMRADGGGVRRIARGRGPGGSYTPSWSPDGRWITFSSAFRTPENPEIYVVRPDGTGLKRLTKTIGDAHTLGDDGWPSFSPDGRRIVFSSNRSGNGEVWTMNANGSGQRRVAGLPGRDDWHPRFSRDGRSIAFHSLRLSADERLYVVRADGKGLRRLPFDGSEVDWRPTPPARALAAAPPREILFTRHLGGTGVGDLYTVRPDGSGLRRLTTTRNSFDGVYSTDGTRIVFASDRGRAGAPELYVMDANGRNARRITRSPVTAATFAANFQPTWSPDGRRVVFVRTQVTIKGAVETTDLWSVEPGKAPRRVTTHPGREASPAFTSTGVLTFERDGRIYRLVGGRARPELRGSEPAWAPRGGYLAFVRDGAVHVTFGGVPMRIAAGGSPAWSADGKRLVYSTIDGLHAVSVPDGEPVRLTETGYPRSDLSPSWRR